MGSGWLVASFGLRLAGMLGLSLLERAPSAARAVWVALHETEPAALTLLPYDENADEAATRGAAYLALLMVRHEAGDKIELAELLSQVVELTDRVEPNAEHTKLYKKLLPKFEKSLDRLTALYS